MRDSHLPDVPLIGDMELLTSPIVPGQKGIRVLRRGSNQLRVGGSGLNPGRHPVQRRPRRRRPRRPQTRSRQPGRRAPALDQHPARIASAAKRFTMHLPRDCVVDLLTVARTSPNLKQLR